MPNALLDAITRAAPRSTLRALHAFFVAAAVGCAAAEHSAPAPVDNGKTPAPAPVATIEVVQSSIATHPQWIEQLDVVLRDAAGNALAGRTVTWASSNANIATVERAGSNAARVVGMAPGDAGITIESEGITANVPVAVTEAAVAAITILPGSALLSDGMQLQLSAALTDARGYYLTRPISWASANEGVATVSAAGRVTAVLPGAAEITATSGDRSARIALTVRPHVEQLVVDPTQATLRVGEHSLVVATLKDVDGNVITDRAVTFIPSDPGVVALLADGRITALTAGTTTIIARSESRTATVAISVIERVIFVRVTPNAATLPVGSQTQLVVTLLDPAGRPLTGRAIDFTSSSLNVASVSASGLVTAVGEGTATITITSEGVSTTTRITVPKP
jgi:trimeric autotransporter adhesin